MTRVSRIICLLCYDDNAPFQPFFSRDKISHFDIFDGHAEDVISIIKQRTRAGYSVDFQVCILHASKNVFGLTTLSLQDLIGRFTMDSATEFLFGTCVQSLKANIPYGHNVAFPPPQSSSAKAQTANKFIEAFNESMQVIAEREYIGAIWPLFEISRDKSAAAMKIVSAFLDPIIAAAIEKKRAAEGIATEEKGDVEAETLLDELLSSTSGTLLRPRFRVCTESLPDPKVLKDET